MSCNNDILESLWSHALFKIEQVSWKMGQLLTVFSIFIIFFVLSFSHVYKLTVRRTDLGISSLEKLCSTDTVQTITQ